MTYVPYMTVDEVRERTEYKADDFYATDEEERFDELLERVEEEAGATIDSFMGDTSFHHEEGVELEVPAPRRASIELLYPVQDVLMVEVLRARGGDFQEIDENRYYFTEHRLYLHEGQKASRSWRRRGRASNPLRSNIDRVTWADMGRLVRVTYNRGYTEVPANVKSVQMAIINNILRNLRLEQSIGSISPDAVSNYVNNREVMTEDIEKRLKQLTRFGGTTMVI